MDHPLGTILLDGADVTADCEMPISPHCFRLICGSGKIFYIQCSSEDDKREWMKAIVNNIYDMGPVSDPFNVMRKVHVDYNSEAGLVGLPLAWENWIKKAEIGEDEFQENPSSVLHVLYYLILTS